MKELSDDLYGRISLSINVAFEQLPDKELAELLQKIGNMMQNRFNGHIESKKTQARDANANDLNI